MGSTQESEALVVIPTYNERDTIRELIQHIQTSIDTDILIVDDASPDGTGRIVDEIAALNKRLSVVHRPSKQGLGSAYREGFSHALARGYTIIIQMDADFSHDPDYLSEMVAQSDRFDLVIGSRYVVGGRIRNWKRLRKLTSWAGNVYARTVLRLKDKRYQIYDSTSGFKLWHSKLLRAIDTSKINSEGYAFQIALHWYAVQHDARIIEIPVVFEDRKAGQSKISGMRVVFESLLLPWKIKRRKIIRQE